MWKQIVPSGIDRKLRQGSLVTMNQLCDLRRFLALTATVLAIVFVGCKSTLPSSQRCVVSGELVSRAGAPVGPGRGLAGGSLPPGTTINDGISEDEAVAAALWNNAALNELLAQLGVSRAQLYDAGLITDPQLILFFPLGPKQLEFTLYQSVDAIWLRPVRQRAAELDLCELSRQMIQNGLNTARDARTAHANLLLAQNRAELTAEGLRLRESIAGLADKRLEAGDISELEVLATRIDALTIEAAAVAAVQDVTLAQEQLRVVMGVDLNEMQLVAVSDGIDGLPIDDKETLVAMAHAMRPDLRAIEIRKAAALRRVQLARKQFITLDAVYDANGEGLEGFESGPGLRGTIPIFNGNKGKVAVAEAMVQQVDRQYSALRDQIELDVRTAVVRLEQALEQRRLITEQILPVLTDAQELAQRNFEGGGVPYFLVLQTTTQYVDAQLNLAAANATVRIALADLERSVGRRIATTSTGMGGQSPLLGEEAAEGTSFQL